MAGLGYLAQSNTATYNVGGLDTYITDHGSYKVVDCYLYFRRTLAWASTQYAPSVSATVSIDGTSGSGSFSITIPANSTSWVGPYVHVSKRFEGAATTATISWSSTDSSSYASGGPYFSGSGSATITVPASYTAPTGLAFDAHATASSVYGTASVTGWGTGGSTAGHSLKVVLSGWGYMTNPYKYAIAYPGDSLSASLTIDDNSPYTGAPWNIEANQSYYYAIIANNGAAEAATAEVEVYTPPAAITATATNVTDSSLTIQFSGPADGGHSGKVIYAHCRDIWGNNPHEIGTELYGDAYSGTYAVSGLTPDTDYEIEVYAWTYAGGAGQSTTLRVHTQKQYKIYGSVSGSTAAVSKVYGSVNRATKEVVKIYGSDNGVTKRIY